MIKAVVFDLDDTLFPEIEYVKSGFFAIAGEFGDKFLYDRLWALFSEDRNGVYQRAGFSEAECRKCIEIYREHFPNIKLDAETVDLLKELKSKGVLMGIITDGRPEGQKNKIKALGLDEIMDCIIVTDELGGTEFRKPNPKPFEMMKEKFGVEFEEMMYVGDNPTKDFFIGSVYPITTVRSVAYSGLYVDEKYLNDVKEHIRIQSLSEIVRNEYV